MEETVYSLESNKVEYIELDSLTALRTPYRIDIKQPLYFTIDSFEELFAIQKENLEAILNQAKELGSFEPKFPPKDDGKSPHA